MSRFQLESSITLFPAVHLTPARVMPARVRRRHQLRLQSGWRFVPRAEFERLAVSVGASDRADDFAAGLRGLRDRRTGITFAIEAEARRERQEPASPSSGSVPSGKRPRKRKRSHRLGRRRRWSRSETSWRLPRRVRRTSRPSELRSSTTQSFSTRYE
jgi:hypothetical protein